MAALANFNGARFSGIGRKRPDRGWEDDPQRVEALPPGTGIDEVAQRVTSSVQTALDVEMDFAEADERVHK